LQAGGFAEAKLVANAGFAINPADRFNDAVFLTKPCGIKMNPETTLNVI
jgi:hypothetical protein